MTFIMSLGPSSVTYGFEPEVSDTPQRPSSGQFEKVTFE